MKELRYEIRGGAENGECVLLCPFGKRGKVTGNIIRLGSGTCYGCEHNKGRDDAKKEVKCNADEKHGTDEYDLQEAKREKEQHDIAVKNSGIGKRYINKLFSNYETTKENENQINSLTEFARNPGDSVVLITGTVGLGKTHLGAAILYETKLEPKYCSMREVCIEIAVSRSFRANKDTKTVLEEYCTAGMLVIDEIGRGSDKTDEKMFLGYVLNRRYEDLLPTVLVTNLGWGAVSEILGESITDRLRETGKSISLTGDSWRSK